MNLSGRVSVLVLGPSSSGILKFPRLKSLASSSLSLSGHI